MVIEINSTEKRTEMEEEDTFRFLQTGNRNPDLLKRDRRGTGYNFQQDGRTASCGRADAFPVRFFHRGPD